MKPALSNSRTSAPFGSTSRAGIHGRADFPVTVREAWQWRQLNDELDRRAQVSLGDIQERLSQLEREITVCTAELIEQKA
jgi:hypothetical protein